MTDGGFDNLINKLSAPIPSPAVFQPTEQQRSIFDFIQDGQGHAVVVARAGTGKTRTIVEALSYVPEGSRVLCCAFNVRIRDVLLERVPDGVRVRTLHQLGRDTMMNWRAFKNFKHDEGERKDRTMATQALAGSWIQQATERAVDSPESQMRVNAAKAFMAEVVERVERGATLVKATLTKDRPGLLALIEQHELDIPGLVHRHAGHVFEADLLGEAPPAPPSNVVKDPAVDGVPAEEMAEYIAKAVRFALDAWPKTSFDDEVWLPVHNGIGLFKYDFVFVDEAQDLTLCQLRLAQSALAPGGRLIAVGDPAQAIYSWRGADVDAIDRIVRELSATTFPLSTSFRCPRKVVELAQRHVPDFTAAPGAPMGHVEDISVGVMKKRVRPNDFILSRTNAPLASIALALKAQKTPAKVVGSADVGRTLTNMIRRSRKRTTAALLEWLDSWLASEKERLKSRAMALSYAEDKVETIKQFAKGVESSDDVAAKIEEFFIAEQSRRDCVLLSTVHRLKGDEAARVFLLTETFFLPHGDAKEEANIHYVATTRSMRELYRVSGLYPKKGGAPQGF